jgi:hypothetical protein
MLKYFLTNGQEPYRMWQLDGRMCRSIRCHDNPDQNYVSFILLVKLKCNIDHICGLYWVLANTTNFLKIHYISSVFFRKIHFYKKRKTSHDDFLIERGSNKLPQKPMDE